MLNESHIVKSLETTQEVLSRLIAIIYVTIGSSLKEGAINELFVVLEQAVEELAQVNAQVPMDAALAGAIKAANNGAEGFGLKFDTPVSELQRLRDELASSERANKSHEHYAAHLRAQNEVGKAEHTSVREERDQLKVALADAKDQRATLSQAYENVCSGQDTIYQLVAQRDDAREQRATLNQAFERACKSFEDERRQLREEVLRVEAESEGLRAEAEVRATDFETRWLAEREMRRTAQARCETAQTTIDCYAKELNAARLQIAALQRDLLTAGTDLVAAVEKAVHWEAQCNKEYNRRLQAESNLRRRADEGLLTLNEKGQ